MFPGAEFAEVDAGREGDAGAVEHFAGELFAIAGEGTDVGIDEEAAVRQDGDLEADFAERGRKVVPSCLEFRPASLGNGVGGVGEAGQRSMLRKRRRRDVEVLRQLFEIAHMTLGRDQPAKAPTGHVPVF